jgi:drug/metabolite transporter (DMT)-like permease
MQISENTTRTGRKKVLDIGLYVLISVVVVGSIFLGYALGIPHEEFMRWFGLIGATLVIFGFAISQNRNLWDKNSFWILLTVIFIAHCCVFAGLAIAKTNLTGFKVMVICFTEISLMNILKNIIYRERP